MVDRTYLKCGDKKSGVAGPESKGVVVVGKGVGSAGI